MSNFTPYSEYFEADSSPLATQQERYLRDLKTLQAKATYWDVFCTVNADAPECKVYED